MKKIGALIIIMVMVISAVPVFADSTGAVSREEYRKKPLYDKIMDPIKNFKFAQKDTIYPFAGDKVTVFQNTANGIKEGSAKAKQQSGK